MKRALPSISWLWSSGRSRCKGRSSECVRKSRENFKWARSRCRAVLRGGWVLKTWSTWLASKNCKNRTEIRCLSSTEHGLIEKFLQVRWKKWYSSDRHVCFEARKWACPLKYLGRFYVIIAQLELLSNQTSSSVYKSVVWVECVADNDMVGILYLPMVGLDTAVLPAITVSFSLLVYLILHYWFFKTMCCVHVAGFRIFLA